MRIKHLCVLIRTKVWLVPLNTLKPSSYLFQGCASFMGHFCYFFMFYPCYTALSVPCSLVVTCLQMAEILALFSVLCFLVFFSRFYIMSQVWCGT